MLESSWRGITAWSLWGIDCLLERDSVGQILWTICFMVVIELKSDTIFIVVNKNCSISFHLFILVFKMGTSAFSSNDGDATCVSIVRYVDLYFT